jgi:hypothetical protein
VGARKKFTVEFQVDGPTDIVFSFSCPATDFELVRAAPAGGGEVGGGRRLFLITCIRKENYHYIRTLN